MKRAMRRAWRRDIKDRKLRRRSEVGSTWTDIWRELEAWALKHDQVGRKHELHRLMIPELRALADEIGIQEPESMRRIELTLNILKREWKPPAPKVSPHDKTWDDVTPHEDLQQLLYALLVTQSLSDKREAVDKLEEWLEDNIQGCAAELYAATRLDQASYCDEIVAPGHGEYCESHQEME